MQTKRLHLYIYIAIIAAITYQGCKSPKSTYEYIPDNSKVWGLDFSHYQQITDWDLFSEQRPGFVFLKATEGTTIQDEKYNEYYNEIRKYEIPVGSYHFFTYKSSGADQASNFLNTVKYQKGDLPLVLDAEYAKKMPDAKTVVRELQSFLKVVYNKTGIFPIIYCNYRYYLQYLKGNLTIKCHFWIVDYQGKPNCEWTFWQTTDKYRVAGVKGYVDFNIFSGTRRDLQNMLLQ